MGFCVDFTDNKAISAEILNDILAEVGDGSVSASSEFTDGSLFYTDKLNCIRSEIVTGGIRSGCKAALCETGVIIGEGLCFFDSGMRMKIDAEGITLPTAEGKENFVYLYASPISNVATAVVTTEEKEGSEYVPICKIDETGKIYDTRAWCRAKIPMMNSNFMQRERVVIENNQQSGKVLVATVPLANKAYSHIIFMSEYAISVYFRDINKFTYIATDNNHGDERREDMDYFRVGYYHASYNPYNAQLTFEEKDSCLKLYAEGVQTNKELEMLVI